MYESIYFLVYFFIYIYPLQCADGGSAEQTARERRDGGGRYYALDASRVGELALYYNIII